MYALFYVPAAHNLRKKGQALLYAPVALVLCAQGAQEMGEMELLLVSLASSFSAGCFGSSVMVL